MDHSKSSFRRATATFRTLGICLCLVGLSLFLIGGCDDDDDDVYWPPSKPKALISATTVLAVEGGTQGGFTITLSKKAPKNLSIAYTVGGTADAADHDLISGTVAIAKGATSATITVSAVDDDLEEVVETILVTLAPGSGYDVGSLDMANVAIPANDTPQATVSVMDATATETSDDSDAAIFKVALSTTPMEDKIVGVSFDGTATYGTDYPTLPLTVTIAAGTTSKTVEVVPVDDSVLEDPETVIVNLSSGTGYSLGTSNSATATIHDDEKITVVDLNMQLMPIPAGTFTMGQAGVAEPAHQVTLTQPFWMGRTEVTQIQYMTLAGSNPSYFTGYTSLPVERVSWNDAVAFCQALTTRESGNIPAGYAYRLPTEAEWEYACRAGSTTAFSYGDDSTNDGGMTYTDLGYYAWYFGNGGSTTHPVAGREANAWGLYDMHGNVWEWCHDWYSNYSTDAQTDPTGPSTGSNRVLRGGSWGSYGGYCRSASRGFDTPSYTDISYGFRVVLAPVLP